MARTRLVIHMVKGDPHFLDFGNEEDAAAALKQVNDALAAFAQKESPTTIADRLVVRPVDVRSAELTEPPRLI